MAGKNRRGAFCRCFGCAAKEQTCKEAYSAIGINATGKCWFAILFPMGRNPQTIANESKSVVSPLRGLCLDLLDKPAGLGVEAVLLNRWLHWFLRGKLAVAPGVVIRCPRAVMVAASHWRRTK